MSKNYLMAVDAGTGSVRAVLFDLEGNQIGCSQQEWDHKEDRPGCGKDRGTSSVPAGRKIQEGSRSQPSSGRKPSEEGYHRCLF